MHYLTIRDPKTGSTLLEGKYRFRSQAIIAGKRKLRQCGLEIPSDRTWYRISNNTDRTSMFSHIQFIEREEEVPPETTVETDGLSYSSVDVSKITDANFARIVQNNHLEIILTSQGVSRGLNLELKNLPNAPILPNLDCFYEAYFKRLIESPRLLPDSGPRVFWMALPKQTRENYQKSIFPREMLYNSYFEWCGLYQLAVVPHHRKWFDYILSG